MPLHSLQEEWDADLVGTNPLDFPGYTAPAPEAVRTGIAIAAGDARTVQYVSIESCFDIMAGSMGAAVGEKVVRAYRRAAERRLPVVVIASSGGARLQEGMVALIQLARTSAAARVHAEAGLLSVAVFRAAVTGGVFASYASLCDVKAAEHGAVIGFAGPRVVELTTGEELPRESHTAASARRNALVDALTDPARSSVWVEAALGASEVPLGPARPLAVGHEVASGDAWQEVQRARSPNRATGIDWAAALCSSWTELAGTDRVVRAALATVGGKRAVVIATDRYERDGRPRVAGFRLAQRAAGLADRLGLPLLSFVDTVGADPRAPSEAAGLAQSIAETFAALAGLRTTSVSVCVGEGGSGGALALAATDRLLMLEHSVFSVIGPEGAAAILDRDITRAPERAHHLRMTARDVVQLGVADTVVAEDREEVRGAVLHALETAVPGDRHRRLDSATHRTLRSST